MKIKLSSAGLQSVVLKELKAITLDGTWSIRASEDGHYKKIAFGPGLGSIVVSYYDDTLAIEIVVFDEKYDTAAIKFGEKIAPFFKTMTIQVTNPSLVPQPTPPPPTITSSDARVKGILDSILEDIGSEMPPPPEDAQ